MHAILRMEGRRRGGWMRVAVLCLLFGLWSFISLAGAGVHDTFCELGVVTIGGTATVSGAADNVVVAFPADDVLAIAVTPDLGGAMLTPMSSIGTATPLPGILVAGQPQPPKCPDGTPPPCKPGPCPDGRPEPPCGPPSPKE